MAQTRTRDQLLFIEERNLGATPRRFPDLRTQYWDGRIFTTCDAVPVGQSFEAVSRHIQAHFPADQYILCGVQNCGYLMNFMQAVLAASIEIYHCRIWRSISLVVGFMTLGTKLVVATSSKIVENFTEGKIQNGAKRAILYGEMEFKPQNSFIEEVWQLKPCRSCDRL